MNEGDTIKITAAPHGGFVVHKTPANSVGLTELLGAASNAHDLLDLLEAELDELLWYRGDERYPSCTCEADDEREPPASFMGYVGVDLASSPGASAVWPIWPAWLLPFPRDEHLAKPSLLQDRDNRAAPQGLCTQSQREKCIMRGGPHNPCWHGCAKPDIEDDGA